MVLGSTSVFCTTWQHKNEDPIIITFSRGPTKGAKCSKSTKWQTWWPDEPVLVVAAPHTRRDTAGAGWLKVPPAVHVSDPCTGFPVDWMFWEWSTLLIIRSQSFYNLWVYYNHCIFLVDCTGYYRIAVPLSPHSYLDPGYKTEWNRAIIYSNQHFV